MPSTEAGMERMREFYNKNKKEMINNLIFEFSILFFIKHRESPREEH